MRARTLPVEALAWLAPAGVFAVVRWSPLPLPLLLAGALAACLVLALSRRPIVPLVGLIAGLPVGTLVLSYLYRLGLPGEVVRPLGQWKEVCAAALVLAALQRYSQGRPRLDVIDKLALGYIAIGLLYLAVPQLTVLGGTERTLSERGFGFRFDVLYVGLFLAARHLRFDALQLKLVVRAVLVAVALVAVVGVFEWTASDTWNRVIIEDIQLPRYRVDVLGVSPVARGQSIDDLRVYGSVGGREIVRVGSVQLDPLSTSFFLAFGVCIAVELVIRGRTRRSVVIISAVAVAALLFTQTRAGILAAAVGAVLALGRTRGGSQVNRLRFALALGGVAVFAVPLVVGAGLSDRLAGDEASDTSHREAFTRGVETIVQNPLGVGLATAGGAGQRVTTDVPVVTENQYLQIGVQLGVPAMVLYLGLVVGVPRLIRRRITSAGDDDEPSSGHDDRAIAGAARTGFVGLCVGGFFLQPFLEFSVSWTVWAVLGACIGRLDDVATRGSQRGELALRPA